KSKDATSQRGGDVGYFSKGQFIPEFENEVFKLKPGGISDVVKTGFGYHIIMLTDKKNPEVQELSAVKEPIRKELEKEQKKKLFEELMSGLKSNAAISINEELLKEDPEEETGVEEGRVEHQ
ncbi:MAG: peptidylprolyl isomerase, partial [Candidatus Omnitrophota bacterium]|nr:peptidylprolyl isomerase [Candidatus Omnitrophota bacterium]